MRKSSLLAVFLLFATSSTFAENQYEVDAALDSIDKYHTLALSCRAEVIKHNEAGMDRPPCVEFVDGLDTLVSDSQILGNYVRNHRDDMYAIPPDRRDRVLEAGSKANTIADTITLLCGSLNWCYR